RRAGRHRAREQRPEPARERAVRRSGDGMLPGQELVEEDAGGVEVAPWRARRLDVAAHAEVDDPDRSVEGYEDVMRTQRPVREELAPRGLVRLMRMDERVADASDDVR